MKLKEILMNKKDLSKVVKLYSGGILFVERSKNV